MRTLIVAITFFIFCADSLFAQNATKKDVEEITVLKQRLSKATKDEVNVELTSQIATAYRSNFENDSCKKYALQALNLTKKLIPATKNKQQLLKYKILKAKSLENFGSVLVYDNAVIALDTLYVSLRLSQETGNKEGIAMAYFSVAEVYSYQGKQLQAIEYFTKSLKLFKEANNKINIARTLYSISLQKRYLGMFGDALEYSISSLKVAQEIKDTLLITDALLGNSFNYLLAKNYNNALLEQEKALKLFKLIKDTNGVARTYNDMGVTNIYAGKLDDALKYHKIALQMRKKLKDANAISVSYNYIASVYRKQGELKKALIAVKEGIPYSLQFGDIRFIMDSYLEAGDIYAELKDFQNAIANYNLAKEVAIKNNSQNYEAITLMQIGKAHKNSGNTKMALVSLKMADKTVLPNDYSTRMSIYKKMTEVYLQNSDYKNSYETQLKFNQMNDSINASEKAEKITELTQKLIYESERDLQKASQDKEIAIKETQLAKQKIVRNWSITGLLLGIALALVFFVRFKEKRKLNIALEQTLIDLKETQTQLIQSEKMASLGELTAGIAHEIQNPLNFVNNFSEVSAELLAEMQDEIDKGNLEDAKEILIDVLQNLEKINHHGKRADAIVKGMLQHSRSSSGKKEMTDLNALCDEYLRLSYHGLRAKDKSFNATMKTDFDETISKIEVIPQDFGRVVLNLLNNAFYACTERSRSAVNEKSLLKIDNYEPTVSVTTKKENDKILIQVSDNGNGMSKEIMDKVFQPFFTTKPTGQGTGLGLSLSYDIITKAHGGELKVKSEENVGTTFSIIIPD